MNIEQSLNDIWNKDYIGQLPSFVKKRGFMYSINNSEKDILITGINPSFRETDRLKDNSYDFQAILNDPKKDNYWGNIKKQLLDPENNIDLRSQSAYLDIFYFREKDQNQLRKGILKTNNPGIHFSVDQLKVTQQVIEDIIKPKVIIVKNRESSAYWGENKKYIWMGYQLELIQSYPGKDKLYKITGLLNSKERISKEIKKTNLEGSLILFTVNINQYTTKEVRETRGSAIFAKELLERYNNSSL